MTTLSAVRRVPAVPRSVSVALSLGRVEARKLLRHPITLVGVALSIAYAVGMTWIFVPVLNRYDAVASESVIVLAAALFLVAQLSTGRAKRSGTTELFEGCATSEVTVTTGHLISVFYVASLSLFLVIAELAYMKVIGGVTSPRPIVMMIGPTLVVFAGWLGVAVGRWAPQPFMGPLVLAGLVGFTTITMTTSEMPSLQWLSLWVQSEVLKEVPSEVTIRPYEWRILYVGGLAALALGAAMTQHRRSRAGAIVLSIAAIAAIAFAGGMQMQTDREKGKTLAAALAVTYDEPHCTEYASVTYCPYPGYESWVDRWREPTEGVLGATPTEARPDDLRFLQAPAESGLDWFDPVAKWIRHARNKGVLSLDTDITPTLQWGRNGHESTSELAIALLVAGRTIGAEPPRRRDNCSLVEQGRAIVGLWLGAQATGGTEATLRAVAERNPYLVEVPADESYYPNPIPWELEEAFYEYAADAPYQFGIRDLAFADQLLHQDEALVRTVIADNWDNLVDPATTSDQAAQILALDPLPSLEGQIEGFGSTRGGPKCR